MNETTIRNTLAFTAGVTVGILSNIIPSLPEHRKILLGEDDGDKTALRDAWLIVAVSAGVALGLMFAAGWHKRQIAL